MLAGSASIYVALVLGIVGLGFVIWKLREVLSEDAGNEKMQQIAAAVQEGASAFLNREYTYLSGFVVVVALIIGFFVNWLTAISFVTGALTSAAAGYLGMWTAVRSNVRTAAAASRSLNDGLRVAFGSGSIMGMAVVSFSLIGITVLYIVFSGLGHSMLEVITYIAGFSFGASSIALFARVGGGIYTKAADVGADLVGKVEQGIPEDDPRNPAVIADNVGDNVGDVAGMGADLFESYSGSIIACATLGLAVAATLPDQNLIGLATLPFLVAAVGIIASLIGTFLVKTQDGATQHDLLKTLRTAVYGASGLVLVLAAIVVPLSGLSFLFWVVILIGLLAGNGISFFTEYYTSYSSKPTQGIAAASETGPATLIIQGLSVGMMSTVGPAVIVAVAILLSYLLGLRAVGQVFDAASATFFANGGLYAVALAGVGMLSTLGVTLASDAYGPVADNAGGIAEMSDLPDEVRDRTDALDSLGNTTAATGKGFAIGSAVLTALALMAAYVAAVGAAGTTINLNMLDPKMLPGLIIGAVLPFLFSALTMTAVGKAAFQIVLEVRRQFREIPGLMEGTGTPDYRTCVAISTQAPLRGWSTCGMAPPSMPCGRLHPGRQALTGLLISIASGFMLAVMMANSSGRLGQRQEVDRDRRDGR